MRLSVLFIPITAVLALQLFSFSTSKTDADQKKPQLLDKSLVYAFAEKYETREMWEKELAYRLSIRGFNVVTSISIDPGHKKPYTVDELRAIIKKHGIEGIITMKFKDLQKKGDYSESDRYISQPEGQRYWFNYLNPNMNVYNWTYITQETVTIESNVYDANTEEIVFHTEASVRNAESNEALAGEITEILARDIQRSKVLKRTKTKKK
jgi:hypothetical protein